MNTRRVASLRPGALLSVLLLAGSALILTSCFESNATLGVRVQNIYVTQQIGEGAGSVSVFPLTATGNVAPAATITGANTGFVDLHGVSVQ